LNSKLPKKRHATLTDIATVAGVTPMTVSRVVNDNGYVSVETREKVLRVLSELNYRRNGLARGLKRQRTDTMGLVLGDIANPFAAELAHAVREVTSMRGYNLFICVSEHSAKEDIAAFDSLADHRVDGLIVATRANKLGNDRLADMIDRGIPVVLIGRDFRHPNVDLVSADHLRGGYDATRHLIQLGHERIGFIGITLSSGLGLRRFQGYLDALREHGLPIDEKLIVGRSEMDEQAPGYSTETMGYRGMKQLLALRKPPTAVFARNDFTAIGAISAIKEAGLRIPHDIAVVGYDDVPLAAHTSPPLTTVRQPTREQGRIAAEFLLRRIEAPDTLPREERILECELVVRESTSASEHNGNNTSRSRLLKLQGK
jgi:DNA-binding LacI/PurR family transcriptional regulator